MSHLWLSTDQAHVGMYNVEQSFSNLLNPCETLLILRTKAICLQGFSSVMLSRKEHHLRYRWNHGAMPSSQTFSAMRKDYTCYAG